MLRARRPTRARGDSAAPTLSISTFNNTELRTIFCFSRLISEPCRHPKRDRTARSQFPRVGSPVSLTSAIAVATACCGSLTMRMSSDNLPSRIEYFDRRCTEDLVDKSTSIFQRSSQTAARCFFDDARGFLMFKFNLEPMDVCQRRLPRPVVP